MKVGISGQINHTKFANNQSSGYNITEGRVLPFCIEMAYPLKHHCMTELP